MSVQAPKRPRSPETPSSFPSFRNAKAFGSFQDRLPVRRTIDE